MIETKRLANMMKNSKELGYNPTRIFHHITKNESLSEHQTKLQQVIDNLKEKEQTLRQQHGKLSAEIHTLTNQKEALKASINTLTENSLNQIEQNWETAQEKLEKISKEETDIITQHLSETKKTLAFVKKERDKSFVHINAMVKETETSIKEIRDLASETGREMGKLEVISPMIHLIEGSGGQPHEIYFAMTIISQQFKSWLNKNTNDSHHFRFSLDALIRDLNSVMRQ
jgi:chromosome segregation ATPase